MKRFLRSAPVLVIAFTIAATLSACGSSTPLEEATVKAAPKDLAEIYDTDCYADYESTELFSNPEQCVLTNPSSDFSVYLVGDSHAAHWVPTIVPVAQEQGWKLTFLGKRSCSMHYLPTSEMASNEYPSCIEWRKNLEAELLEQQPDAVISGMYSISGTLKDEIGVEDLRPGSPAEEAIADGIVRAWTPLVNAGIQVVAITDTPHQRTNGPECLLEHLNDPESCYTEFSTAVSDQPHSEVRAAEKLSEVGVVDLNDSICRDDKCYASDAATVIYRDKHHLTETFAAQLQGEFARQLKSVPLFAEHMQ